jgi:hypothetical protein
VRIAIYNYGKEVLHFAMQNEKHVSGEYLHCRASGGRLPYHGESTVHPDRGTCLKGQVFQIFSVEVSLARFLLVLGQCDFLDGVIDETPC